MNSRTAQRFSPRSFVGCIALLLLGFLAFPVYQAIQINGTIFYANGIDEAAHLSYPYSSYVQQVYGNLRLSSALVVFLHTLGFSGAYCNVIFDLFSVLVLTLGVYRLFRLLGFGTDDSRRGAILLFVTPLLFCPTNFLVEIVNQAHFAERYIQWTSVPFNTELPFARSPEPQMSWMMIVLWLNVCAGFRWPTATLVAIVPALYSFVRLPFLFVVLAAMKIPRVPLWARIVGAWIVLGGCMVAYLGLKQETRLESLFLHSRLPMLPFTGIASLLLWILLRGKHPASLSGVIPILVASTWVGPNIQIISGLFTAPVNYEQYWGVVISGLLLTLLILIRSARPNLWVGVALLVFAVQSMEVWKRNCETFATARQRPDILEIAQKAPERLAISDIHVTTYMDLAYPMQPHTLFSFSRIYHQDSGENYQRYLCGRRYIESNNPESIPAFSALFSRLDAGYASRGGLDRLVTAERVKNYYQPPRLPGNQLECSNAPLPLVVEVHR
jgi:hypothetical protein